MRGRRGALRCGDQPFCSAFLKVDVLREHDARGAHLVPLRTPRHGRHDAALAVSGKPQQPAPERDDGRVAGAEMLILAVDDRPHAFLDSGVLRADPGNAGAALLALHPAVEAVVVVAVEAWPVRA